VVDNLVAQGRRPALTNQADHGDGSPGGLGLRVMSYEAVPACVFTHPEIATVGLTEGEAAQRGLAARVSRFPFMAVGKAQAMGEPEGFVKLVAEAQNGRLIGGHILGQHASELIAPVALAVQCGLTAPQLADTIFAHPTLSEAIQESAAGVMGQSTHIFVRR
jgi:dihydrolipoamide dehydrogenase